MTTSDPGSTARTPAAARARLQQVLDGLVADGAPGALAQLRDEHGTWDLSSGTAELGTERLVAAHGWFRIGSVTKTFTATVILQLVGEGRLGFDDTVERWLPGLVPDGHTITVRQLLDHTSGLYNYTADLTNDTMLRDRFRQWRPQDVVALATGHDPLFPPGTSRAYCNTGYILLGMVIERVTGHSYGHQVDMRILRPLDLRHTLVGGSGPLPEPHAHGYLPIGDRLVDVAAFNTSQAWAAGGMLATAGDLNRFYAALLTGGLLGPAELQAMQATVPTGVPGVEAGLGIARVSLPGRVTVWGRDGGFAGYHTWSFHTADCTRQLTVSMTVARNSRPATHELLARVATVFRPGRRPTGTDDT